MSSRLPLPVLLALLLARLCAGQPVVPATAAAPGLADTAEHWRIGIAAFETAGSGERFAYLAHSIPLLLRERLESVPAHHFDEEGRAAAARQVLRRRLRESAAKLASLRRSRDELLFGAQAGREKRTAEYDRQIAEVVEELNRLRQTPPEAVAVPESKPLRVASLGEGGLLEKAVRSPVEAAREAGVDLLVWGAVEQLQGYLYVEARAFDAARESEVFSFRRAAGVEHVSEVAEELADGLAVLVWGREWASLSVRTEPSGAQVWLDDRFVGRAPLDMRFVLPGSARLRVQAPGYASVEEAVQLEPYQRLQRAFTLPGREVPALALSSEPTGAAVYAGADWVGSTPLSLPLLGGPSRLLLRKEGFADTALYLHDDGAQELAVPLRPLDLDPRERQRASRDRFYRAFGLLALSVPVPFFCRALADNYAINYFATGDPQLRDTAQAFYSAYWVGLGLSSVLAVNAVTRLLRYVRAADRKA